MSLFGSFKTSRHIGRYRHRLISAHKKNLQLEALETRTLLAADLIGLSPADDGSARASDNLVLTFGEDVQKGPGLGNIFIRNGADDTIIEVVNVNSDRVTVDGSTVTIDPVNDLPADTSVYVTIDGGAIRDTSAGIVNTTLLAEDFESLPLKDSSLGAGVDDYVVVMSGVLDVKVAGDYTFGINSDDGQQLAIDVAQDGFDVIDDVIIYDNTTHGSQDRIHTCGVEDAVQSCVGNSFESAITLGVGQYAFEYWYFERGGGSSGEFFYAPGFFEAFDSAEFVLVGDDSKGVGVTAEGIKGTTYKAAAGNTINNLTDAEDLVFGFIDSAAGFPAEAPLPTADVYNSGGFGRFNDNHNVPGVADSSDEDWTDEGPFGWTQDNSDLIEGGTDEYHGWNFLSKEFWIAEQGDQDRSRWTLGEGTVLVADPDAHDDFIDNGGFNADACLAVLDFGPECGLFTASVDTPPIYLSGVVENTAVLEFDSSWWDEDTQSAEARVEYFDADGNSIGNNVLLRWESIQASENYRSVNDPDIEGGDTRNEHVVVDLANPAGAVSMIVTFDMPYATNDWWWSVDNVVVTADVAGNVFAGINDNTTWNFTTSGATGSDVTAPGDAVVRVDGANDGDSAAGSPPGGEMVDHVIDNVTQKHLNFLDLGSGFVVTPSAGPSLVTGLRLYTANDAVARDPASYKLEGGLADGSFTLISEGELSLPDARNAGGAIAINASLANQEVLFDNTAVYTSYRLTFPTLKDAAAANSMQIAEVEFLGEIVLADVTAPGDVLVRVDGENDGDGSAGSPPGGEMVVHVIDNVTQKHLNFLDLNSGFEVTPSAGATVVTGLRLYTANDAVPRDPASYVLEGGLADGSFTLISEGDLALPDDRNPGGNIPIDISLFHQEISFENTVAYTSYRLTFPTLKDAAAANSMQIAEVEFLGTIDSPIDLSAGTAAQSSQLGSFVAGNALDDVVNFTHTAAADTNPTWQVLLPASYAFDSVTVFNRGSSGGTTSCCPSRLRDITIQIVDFDGDVTTDFTGGVVTSSSGLLNPENTLGGGVNTAGPVSLTDHPGGAVGNLIRVIRTPDPDLSGTGGAGNADEGSVLSLDLVLAQGTAATLAGDIDGDGTVAFPDFLILSANFGQTVDPGTNGDINGNGVVDFPDFLILSANFGQSAAPVAAAVDAALADLGG